MMRNAKRFLAGLLLCSTLLAALAGCRPETPVDPEQTNPENQQEEDVGAVTYEKVEFVPTDTTEAKYLFNTTRTISAMTTIAVHDRDRQTIYRFRGEKGQAAYLDLLLGSEYLVEMSNDGRNWTPLINYNELWRSRDHVCLDLTQGFTDSKLVYIRISDAEPEDGWGAQLRAVTYHTFRSESGKAITLQKVINDGWTWGERVVAAGTSIETAPGETVTLEKTVKIPSYWEEQAIAISFPWIECQGTPTVKINGQAIASATSVGRDVVIPLPTGLAGTEVTISVSGHATEQGKFGLWSDVRIGLSDLTGFPLATWTLDGVTMKQNRQYLEYGSTDAVLLNALAGNYMNALYDSRYDLLPFSNFDTNKGQELYYVHDTVRSILALCDEERYSPVVRAELIQNLYYGILEARVPGSDYEFFQVRDSRTKQLYPSDNNAAYLQWAAVMDVREPYCDMYVKMTDAAGKTWNAGSLTYTDGETENGLRRTYTTDHGSIVIDSCWADGTEDVPTKATVQADGAKTLSVVFASIHQRFYSAQYSTISTSEETLATGSSRKTTISVPDTGYLVLHTPSRELGRALVITWDVAPDEIRASYAGNYFDGLEFVYEDGSVSPTFTVTPFYGCASNMAWPYTAGENIVADGCYGAGGFNPTYLCSGAEGLGVAALAGSAYIFNKYGMEDAEEAIELALRAIDAAYAADRSTFIPGVMYDRVAACEYLIRLGYTDYIEVAKFYGDKQLADQRGDGTFIYWEPRYAMVLLRAYDITGDERYLTGVNKYLANFTFYEDRIERSDGEVLTTFNIKLYGAGEIALAGHMGNEFMLDILMTYEAKGLDDAGIVRCSDINPYILGWSLAGIMEISYAEDDKKVLLGMDEYVLYNSDGSYEILDHATAYVDNPHRK